MITPTWQRSLLCTIWLLDPGAGAREAFVARAVHNIEHRSLHHHVFDTELALRLADRAGLRIEYVEVELPFHICLMCSTQPEPGTEANSSSPTNARYWSPTAAWRKRDLFPSDRRLWCQ